MPPKASGRGPAAKSRPSRTEAKSYVQDDEIEGDEEGGEEDDDERDPMSTADLNAVIRAFQKGKSKKEKESLRALEKQFNEVLQSTRQSVDATVSTCITRTDQYIASLNLDDETLPGVANDSTFFSRSFEAQTIELTKTIGELDEFMESLLPRSNPFYVEAIALLERRPAAAKKAHKKFSKAVRAQAEEQMAMVELNAQSGPLIHKHLKALVRA